MKFSKETTEYWLPHSATPNVLCPFAVAARDLLAGFEGLVRSKPVSNCVLAIPSTLHCLNCFLILVSTSYESLNSVFSSKIIKNHFKTWSEVEKNGHAGWSQRNARVSKLWERRGEWRWGQAKSGNELHAGLSSELGSQKQRLIQSLSALNQVGSVLIQSYEVSKRRFRW